MKVEKVIGILLLLAIQASTIHVHVNDEDDLITWLYQKQKVDLTLELNSSHNFTIHNDTLLHMSILHSELLIRSDSEKFTNIICQPSKQTGFAFSNVINLTLQRLSFINCGGRITSLSGDKIEPLLSHFTSHQLATLAFIDVRSITLDHVNVTSLGFSVIGLNVENVTLDKVYVTSTLQEHRNTSKHHSKGSGILILLNDSDTCSTSYVNIRKSIFTNNTDRYTYLNSSDVFTYHTESKQYTGRIINAAALTVLHFQNGSAIIQISQSNFKSNNGSVAGAILLIHRHSYKCGNMQARITGSKFERNEYNTLLNHAGVLSFTIFYILNSHECNYTALVIENSEFCHHNESQSKDNTQKIDAGERGLLYIGVFSPPQNVNINFTLKQVHFTQNVVKGANNLIYINQYKHPNDYLYRVLNVTLEGITVQDSKITPYLGSGITGLFTFQDIKNISLIGSDSYPVNFSHNFGSCIMLYNSNIYLKGKIVFSHNAAHRGAALALFQQSLIYVADTLNATFIANEVQFKGGAIYAYAYGINVYKKCTFQVSYQKAELEAVKMRFINNTAVQSGNAIYSTNIYQCFIYNSIGNNSLNEKIYEKLFVFQNHPQIRVNNISTIPTSLHVCDNYMSIPQDIYPGQTMLLSVGSKDTTGQASHTAVTVILAYYSRTNSKYSSMNYNIKLSDKEQVITETSNCTNFSVTFVSTNEQGHSGNEGDGYPILLFVSINDLCTTKYKLNHTKFRRCPLGFALNNGICTCSRAIQHYSSSNNVQMTCSINTTTISRTIQWAGNITVESQGAKNTTFGISKNFLNYNLFIINIKESVFYMNTSGVYIASMDGKYARPVCYHTRSGPLCGGCKKEHGKSMSVMFGSMKCGTCSSLWLWTIPLYAIAGLMLVVVLFKLRLTLTNGTLNAVIFYAHAANIGILQWFHYITDEKVVRPFASILKVFLSMLNLNLGFPLCFFHEMDELWKAGLSLLFPMYLLMIILAIACVSHFSVRLSNDISQSSIQVFVTIVHLSFVKLLSALNDVFAYTIVYTDIETMPPLLLWLHDGNIIYGKKRHLILMIATSVTVAIFILPYFFILIGGRYVLRYRYFNKYLRPFHEAIHAPYKDNKYYWFTVRLLLIIYMYLCYIVYFGTDIYAAYALVLPVLIIFTTLNAYTRPFKSKLINYMDLFVNMNLCTVLATTWYTAAFDYKVTSIIIGSSAGAIFVMFVGIITGHILWVSGKFGTINKKLLALRIRVNHYWHQNSIRRRLEYTQLDENASFLEPCSNFREPLISSQRQ